MQKVASLSQVPANRGLGVECDGQKILLVREGEAVRAFSATCPHAGAPLEEGAICEGRIICPWHKAAFRLSDGGLVEPPALAGLARYPVRVEGDDVFVDPRPSSAFKAAPRASKETFAIVGAGAAGAAAAASLREFGFDGRLLLIGRESGLPFDRTALSKFVVAGEMKPEETPLLQPETFYREQRIELVNAEVSGFDVARREVTLEDGRKIMFDQGLIAPGGEPKPIGVEGASLAGVHVLRSREDTKAILADVREGVRAVVLGASFIGLEVAACLRAQKASVAVVSPDEVPFVRTFGQRIGRALRKLHEDNGVVFLAPAKAAKFEGDGRVAAVVLEDGRRLETDLVIVGVGVKPATGFVSGAVLTREGGLVVDTHMRVAEGVYAAGDVAAFPVPPEGRQDRIEHWRVAQIQARVAAENMLGGAATYEAPPFFWTYHYGQNYEYIGHAKTWDDEIVVGDVEGQNFVAFFLEAERVVAVVACQRQRLTAALAERMRAPLTRDQALALAQVL